ncbi:clathrin associated protein complex large subunit [Savitreella phatthalungensis]
MSSLKTFIKSVRATKTASDERAVIQKESAAIRTSFRERPGDQYARRNNVAKLLYLFTLGVPTHYGQIECVKLLASPKFTDKRLGYLGTMLLLDEAQEVITLVTNSLQNDLQHSNQFIVGLALSTLGNIAGQEMSRDLCSDVGKLLGSTNSYIRKKAALCAMRIIRKVPELQENFLEQAKVLLSDRHHGVLLCGLTLASDMCAEDPEIIPDFVPQVPALVKVLKSLLTSGYAPEHDVSGIADPFLQIKIIRFFSILGKDNPDVSEQVNDILTQVASSTEATKNVGNAVLYQTVLTVLEIEADSGLRVLGVNILGKFLSNKDNNIRYVALNTLSKVIDIEPNAVQRHRSTILECLRDPDISIRRRALDLSFALINESNVRVLVRELLTFLEMANPEFKLNMTTQICIAADRFAPNKRWHVDTVLRVLKLAGNFVREEILSSFIRLVATSPELQAYATQRLYAALQQDITQESMTLAGAWTIGEYGDALLSAQSYEDEDLVKDVKPADIVNLFESILGSTYGTLAVSEYIINALVKLSTRLTSPAEISRIKAIIQKHVSNNHVELQQRAVEYGNLFEHPSIIKGVLERMPPPEIKEENRVLGPGAAAKQTRTRKKRTEAENLLDLLGEESASPSSQPSIGAPRQTMASADLLQDLFSSDSGPSSEPAQAQKRSAAADILDLFGSDNGPNPAASVSSKSAAVPATNQSRTSTTQDLFSSGTDDLLGIGGKKASPAVEIEAFDKHDVKLTFEAIREGSGSARLVARFVNRGETLADLNLQAAVPKSMKLQMQPLSTTNLTTSASATQVMKVTCSPGAPIKLRLRISFTRAAGADQITEQVDLAKFPADLTAA